MRYGSVCSGIEAATQAWHPLGWSPAFFSEIERFPCQVLAHHYGANMPGDELSANGVPNLGDMTKFKEWPDYAIDLLVGGTPCQSFSVAGLRKGLADPRGNLMLTYLAIARRYQPRWLVWENVPGVLSSNKGRDFGTFIRGLEECGYHAAWRVLDAQYVRVDGYERAVPQRRRRLFVVGYLGDWRRAAAVLFEREGMSGNSAPRREAGQNVAPTISARPTGGGGLGTDFDLDGGLVSSTGSVAHCLNAGGMGRQDYETETMIAQPYTLAIRGRGESHDLEYRQDGTANALLTPNGGRAGIGVGAICAPVHAIQAGALREDPDSGPDGVGVQADIAYTLEARAEVQAIAFNSREDPEVTFDRSGPLGASSPQAQAIAFAQNTRDEVRIVNGDGLIAGALAAEAGMKKQTYLQQGWAVRRLTPTECERLQGFPDQYTNIPVGKRMAADGPRYKALGNSMAINCMRWIGRRIEAVDAISSKDLAA
ncbi:DNA (cytosine-5-)-methyltransferase [Brucella ciceri]|uniref:DNA (cytosine-5-)-methyltransferase n=1 Tax=Brucella ciceri TaxID=391287 RepID=UPI001F143CD4|nr:DNA (cytosine-5-)-methyltransferase [Brucella ciceri]MCH6203872.1 DNA (cytosine-5-)-methyltransferase [Brucella ciceri]